ncbi:MAG: site-specific DNA-methyltransferase [Planctomycetes bacterium]|nr:site-specific DNA-methyltransferase [Planctomycetota bacterium]
MKKLTDQDPETKSPDIIAENIEQLKALFPEAFTEDKIDFEVLKQLLGSTVDEWEEKYGLNWHGKRRARQIALTPSTGTLRPCPEDSVDWDTTNNLMIEGDNLEVLKLLQKSYAGKVKLFYIDPPYNTGKDFVYPDNFQDNIRNYLELTGQLDDQGHSYESHHDLPKNSAASGRFHTDWLNMMYPRLKLAKNLLSDDGLIFISVDENEFAHLQCIANEVFAEENLLSVHHFQVRYENKSLNERKDFQEVIEYVLIYAKNKEACRINRPFEEYSIDNFVFKIDHSDQPTKSFVHDGKKVEVWTKDFFSITESKPSTENFKETWISGSILTGTGHGSLYLKQIDSRRDIDGDGCLYRIYGIGEDGLGYRYFTNPKAKTSLRGKMYTKIPTVRLEEMQSGSAVKLNPIVNFYNYSGDVGNIRHEGGIPFNAGKKPVKMISQLLSYIEDKNCIVMDFFAGSGTTGHAVMAQNVSDSGHRRSILVQLPEQLVPLDKDNKSLVAICDELGKPRNIAELTKERLRRAGKKIREENPMFAGDLGFRVFKLDSSNIRAWEPDRDNLAATLEQHAEHLKTDRTEEDILFELLLKLGLDLTVPIEQKTIADKTVHSIGAGTLLVCLAAQITAAEVEPLALGIVEWHKQLAPAGETQVVFRDSAFADDVAKTNLTAILQQYGLENVRSL